jgi:hypothetical protein
MIAVSISTSSIDIIGITGVFIVIVVFINFDIAIEPFAVLSLMIVEPQVFEPVFIRNVYRGNAVFTSIALEIRAPSFEHGFLLFLSVRR